ASQQRCGIALPAATTARGWPSRCRQACRSVSISSRGRSANRSFSASHPRMRPQRTIVTRRPTSAPSRHLRRQEFRGNSMKIAILDDYQNVALRMADWSALARRAEITVFNDHVSAIDDVVARLLPFDVVCVMRERTPLSRQVIERLPQLKLI